MPPKPLAPFDRDTLLNAYGEHLHRASIMLDRLQESHGLSEHYRSQVVAQLNSTLYVLAFALPPGTVKIERAEDNEVRIFTSQKAS